MFHTHDTTVALVVDVFEDVFVIHFSGGRLFSTWIVSNLEVSNFIPAFFNVWNNVSLVSLHVVHVEQNFARRAVYRPAYSIGLVRASQEKLWRIAQGFQHHDQSTGLKNFCAHP